VFKSIPQVSDDLVDAYLARRALDYLLGFGLSPLLWRRLGPAARSAGRPHRYTAHKPGSHIESCPWHTCACAFTHMHNRRKSVLHVVCSHGSCAVRVALLVVKAVSSCNAAASELFVQCTSCIVRVLSCVACVAATDRQVVCRPAGRVQSVALRLVSEREDAVQLFVPDEYWTIEAGFALGSDSSAAAGTLPAKLVEVDGQKLSQLAVKTQQQAHELVQRLWQQQQQQEQPLSFSMQPQEQLPQPAQEPVWYTVRSLVKRPVKRNPPPPLVTSTLQQEAARRLGFSARKTMQVAQQLYEGTNAGRAVGGLGWSILRLCMAPSVLCQAPEPQTHKAVHNL